MNNNNSTVYQGISVPGLLGVAFVILKLCHVIDWSWWWVTAPFWGVGAIFIVIMLVVVFAAVIKVITTKGT